MKAGLEWTRVRTACHLKRLPILGGFACAGQLADDRHPSGGHRFFHPNHDPAD
jgi:hypothetical protein